MEDVLLMWPVEGQTLEPLQPLSFSVLDDQESSINLDRLTRSEIAGKLLDHLDQIAEGQVSHVSVTSEKTVKSHFSVASTEESILRTFETEPFDWFPNEKTIDIPIFENLSSPIPTGLQSTHNNVCKPSPTSHYPYFDSPEYEPTFASTNYAFAESEVPGTAESQQQLTYAPSFGVDLAMAAGGAPVIDAVAASPVNPKEEVLTPPESPKDEEILKLLQEIEPDDWEKLMFGERSETPISADTTSTTFSERDEPCDSAASSPYVPSEGYSDNDADYVPSRSVRKMSGSSRGASDGCASSRRRTSKPYSRPSTEERRLRKKEQNKNAATRYRMKKKQEVEESKNEENRLASRNRELRTQLDDISREIKCLKSLMRDVYRKKGLIK